MKSDNKIELVFKEKWYKEDDIIASDQKLEYKITSPPMLTFRNKLRRFFGLNYEWYHTAEVL